MLAKINPKLRLPVLGVVAIAAVGLVTFMVIGGESEQQQVAKKNTNKQSKANTAKKASKRTTTTKRKVVRVSRPGMKYRMVRVVEEPEIAPSSKLRKKADAQQQNKTTKRLATK